MIINKKALKNHNMERERERDTKRENINRESKRNQPWKREGTNVNSVSGSENAIFTNQLIKFFSLFSLILCTFVFSNYVFKRPNKFMTCKNGLTNMFAFIYLYGDFT